MVLELQEKDIMWISINIKCPICDTCNLLTYDCDPFIDGGYLQLDCEKCKSPLIYG